MPEVGRVTVIAEAWIVHVEPSAETVPTYSTFIGDVVAPAVVGSTTVMLLSAEAAAALVSEIALGCCGAGRMTNDTGFESVAGVPGFCNSIESAPAAATSEGSRVIVQRLTVRQLVVRGELLTRSCDVPLPVVATKLSPFTASSKLCCAPAITLDGKTVSMVGPDRTATVAVAVSDGFALLVAVMLMAFGEGAPLGAVKFPLSSIEPHDAPEHPWPGAALEIVHVMLVSDIPATLAMN